MQIYYFQCLSPLYNAYIILKAYLSEKCMEKLLGIVLEVKKHSDRNEIVTLYTRSHGRMVFVSGVAASNRRGRAARLMPLSLVETDVRIVAGKELQRLPGVILAESWQTIYFQPAKLMTAIFLSDFLSHLLRTAQPDAAVFDFIRDSIRLLDGLEGNISNFNIAFLISMLPFAGIQPDISGYSEGLCFDMEAGCYVDTPLRRGTTLFGHAAAHLPVLARMNYYNMRRFRYTAPQRREILDGILKYYGLHIPSSDNLKSLDVLREICM